MFPPSWPAIVVRRRALHIPPCAIAALLLLNGVVEMEVWVVPCFTCRVGVGSVYLSWRLGGFQPGDHDGGRPGQCAPEEPVPAPCRQRGGRSKSLICGAFLGRYCCPCVRGVRVRSLAGASRAHPTAAAVAVTAPPFARTCPWPPPPAVHCCSLFFVGVHAPCGMWNGCRATPTAPSRQHP